MYQLPLQLRRHACPVALLLAALAAVAIVAGAVLDNRALWNGGLIGVSLAPVLMLSYRSQHIIEAIERARQEAYDEGYDDGRGVRPKVVPLREVS